MAKKDMLMNSYWNFRGVMILLLILTTYSVFQNYKIKTLVQKSKTSSKSKGKEVLDIRSKYLNLLEMAVTGSLHDEAGSIIPTAPDSIAPYDKENRERGRDWPPFGHTMIGHRRIRQFREAIFEVVDKKVPGDIVELGVWRGGTCIFGRALLDILNEKNRRVILFDAFEKLEGYGPISDFLAIPLEQVRHNFEKYGVLNDNVEFVKGTFEESLPRFFENNKKMKTAILRIDANFYEAYKKALYYFYDTVPVGGIIIFDDYRSHPDAARAWIEFRTHHGIRDELNDIDDYSAWTRKEERVKVDKTKADKDVSLEG